MFLSPENQRGWPQGDKKRIPIFFTLKFSGGDELQNLSHMFRILKLMSYILVKYEFFKKFPTFSKFS